MIDRKKIFAGILITVFSGLLAGCTVYLPDKETAPDPAARETAEQDVTTTDGNYVYEYTIEGDDLLFDHNGIWATYTREGTDRD